MSQREPLTASFERATADPGAHTCVWQLLRELRRDALKMDSESVQDLRRRKARLQTSISAPLLREAAGRVDRQPPVVTVGGVTKQRMPCDSRPHPNLVR